MGKFDALKLKIKSRMVNADNHSASEINEAFKDKLAQIHHNRTEVNPRMQRHYYDVAWLGTDKVQRKEYDPMCYMMEDMDYGQKGSKQLPLTRDTWEKAYRLHRCAEDENKDVHGWFEVVTLRALGIEFIIEEDEIYLMHDESTDYAWETLMHHLAFSRAAFHHPRGRTPMNICPSIQLP